jgi:hypothetical protein
VSFRGRQRAIVEPVERALEIADSPTHAGGELRKAAGTKEEQQDGEDEDQLADTESAKRHRISRVQAGSYCATPDGAARIDNGSHLSMVFVSPVGATASI